MGGIAKPAVLEFVDALLFDLQFRDEFGMLARFWCCPFSGYPFFLCEVGADLEINCACKALWNFIGRAFLRGFEGSAVGCLGIENIGSVTGIHLWGDAGQLEMFIADLQGAPERHMLIFAKECHILRRHAKRESVYLEFFLPS